MLCSRLITYCSALLECDGMITPTPPSYDPIAAASNQAWMSETGRGAYYIGPLVSRSLKAAEKELAQTKDGERIQDFMSHALDSHGPGSMIYVCELSLYGSVSSSLTCSNFR